MRNSNQEPIGTHGWDTVFAIPISKVNAEIAASGCSPKTFSFSDPNGAYEVEGSFGAWSVTPGGSGKLIHMALPLSVCGVTFKGGAKTVVKDVVVTLEIQLKFLTTSGSTAAGGGTTQALKVRAEKVDSDEPASWIGAVYKTTPGIEVEGAVRQALPGWANAHLGDFDHVFAEVDVNEKLAKGQFQWLAPTTVSYAYTDGATEADSILGVLCMTEGRSDSGATQQLSPGAIPTGAEAGFLISSNRLLEKVLRPAMPKMFKGSKLEDFHMSSDGTKITLAKGADVSFKVKAKGKTVKADLQDLSVWIDVAQLNMHALTESNLEFGIKAYCRDLSVQGIALGKNKKGQQTLVIVQPGSQDPPHHWVEIPDGVKVAEFVIALAAAVAVETAFAYASGLGLLAALLIIAIIEGMIAATPEIISAVQGDDAPAMDPMVLNATGTIRWSGSKAFKLSSAALNSALQLGGALTGESAPAPA